MLIDRLVFDVQLIVYRYIHRTLLDKVHEQYRDMFQQNWNEEEHLFEEIVDHLNNFNNRTTLCLNYRDLNDWNNENYDYGLIYDFYEGRTGYSLPKNYVHAAVWWPLNISDTHVPFLDGKNVSLK